MSAIKKNSKVNFNKSGSGSVAGKVTLPIDFLRAMGINEENRDIEISYHYGKIIISKKTLDCHSTK